MACEEERAEIAVTLVENGANLYIQNKVSQDFDTSTSHVIPTNNFNYHIFIHLFIYLFIYLFTNYF